MADEAPGGVATFAHGAHEELGRIKSDNHKYRVQRKQDREKIAELEKKLAEQAPRVLAADDFKRWELLSKVTLKPDEIDAALKERDDLKAKVARAELREERAKAAQSLEWKAPVLDRLMESEGLHLEWRDVERPKKDDPKGTETVRMAHVRPAADEKAELKPLDKYVETHLADFLPALTAKDDSTTASTRTESNGVPFPKQPVTRKPAGDGPSSEEIASRKRQSGVYGF